MQIATKMPERTTISIRSNKLHEIKSAAEGLGGLSVVATKLLEEWSLSSSMRQSVMVDLAQTYAPALVDRVEERLGSMELSQPEVCMRILQAFAEMEPNEMITIDTWKLMSNNDFRKKLAAAQLKTKIGKSGKLKDMLKEFEGGSIAVFISKDDIA